jgi:hypothetical protein
MAGSRALRFLLRDRRTTGAPADEGPGPRTVSEQGEAGRIARALVRLHGERAEAEAGELWRLYKDSGATNAARVWKRVLTTLAALRAEQRPARH